MFAYKQSIVVRGDLELSRGKWCAQAAHASVLASEDARKKRRSWFRRWCEEGQKKVVLQVPALGELEELKRAADSLGIPSAVVVDYGLTEVDPGTVTCVGIGPAPSELVDKVTGSLKLFK
ncbi:MAG: peptidyl-tRNA hydrolase [Candidatus Brockarchaeota archaeon]|nr:peptidyl-tRNA hydrolase [Candidatus Brockarchaeota archaeon]